MPRVTRFRPAVRLLDDRITPTFRFAAGQDFAVGAGSFAVAVGDFNGDGRADIATADRGAGTVSVLVNTTAAGAVTSSFAPRQVFAVGSEPISIAVGDFNGDGRADIVTANADDNTASVLLSATVSGTAALAFEARRDFVVGVGPSSVSVGDFNNDGRADLAVANGGIAGGGNTATVLLNRTAVGATIPTFAAKQDFAVGSGPSELSVGDINGDGRVDLVVAKYNSDESNTRSTVSVLVNTTAAGADAPAFAARQDFAVGVGPIGVSVGDFDSDGRLDIATAGHSVGTISVLVNTTPAGLAAVTFAASVDYAVGGSPRSISVVDLDGDGRADLATTNPAIGRVSALINATPAGASNLLFTPAFSPGQPEFTVGDNPVQVATGDFNGDGRNDLVTVNMGVIGTEMSVTVLSNTSAGLLATALQAQVGTAGVWGYRRADGTWVNLAPANATALAAAANGNVVANFAGSGVWYYRPASGWSQFNGNEASALAVDALGNPVIAFPGYGTYRYSVPLNNFIRLGTTGATADKLVVSENGDVFADFVGFGVYRFRPQSDWEQINGHNATSLAVDPNGFLAATFSGFGVGLYIPHANGWRSLTRTAATSVAIDGFGNVTVAFAGVGVERWSPLTGTFTSLTANGRALSVATDLYGNVFASFAGGGVWEYRPAVGWTRLVVPDATILSLGR